jgi:hypothetical protein
LNRNMHQFAHCRFQVLGTVQDRGDGYPGYHVRETIGAEQEARCGFR